MSEQPTDLPSDLGPQDHEFGDAEDMNPEKLDPFTFYQPLAEAAGCEMNAVPFVHMALSKAAEDVEEGTHVSASDIALAFGELAREEFGPLALSVVRYWGISSTADIGRIVQALVEAGAISASEEDRFEDFEDVYDLEEVLERSYEIGSRFKSRAR